MACNGASLAAPGPIHNLNDLLLFNGIDWRALCAASYLINLRCDPQLSGAAVGLMIKSLVQTIIRPEMAGHFILKIKECEINFFSAPCCSSATYGWTLPPKLLISYERVLLLYLVSPLAFFHIPFLRALLQIASPVSEWQGFCYVLVFLSFHLPVGLIFFFICLLTNLSAGLPICMLDCELCSINNCIWSFCKNIRYSWLKQGVLKGL